jgi:hypothetical protein
MFFLLILDVSLFMRGRLDDNPDRTLAVVEPSCSSPGVIVN